MSEELTLFAATIYNKVLFYVNFWGPKTRFARVGFHRVSRINPIINDKHHA